MLCRGLALLRVLPSSDQPLMTLFGLSGGALRHLLLLRSRGGHCLMEIDFLVFVRSRVVSRVSLRSVLVGIH